MEIGDWGLELEILFIVLFNISEIVIYLYSLYFFGIILKVVSIKYSLFLSLSISLILVLLLLYNIIIFLLYFQ